MNQVVRAGPYTIEGADGGTLELTETVTSCSRGQCFVTTQVITLTPLGRT